MSNRKYFVLDTNVLLHNPASITSFADNIIILSMTVIEELDKFKRQNDELGRSARQVIRHLDNLRQHGSLKDGVAMDNGGLLQITLKVKEASGTFLDLSRPDNRIIAVAYDLLLKEETVIFVSKDINARLKADALGIQVMDFEKEKCNYDELYTGYRNIIISSAEVDRFHQDKTCICKGYDFLTNEFVLLADETNTKHSGLAIATNHETLAHLNSSFDHAWNIHSRSKEQRMALELLMSPEINLVTLIGQAGTGKTLLALAAGLDNVLHYKNYEKLLVSRPIVPLGKDIGYIPGTKEEKINTWMQPIFDNLTYLMRRKTLTDSETVQHKIHNLLEDQLIELEPLTYMRGRSIPKQFVIIDEAQNLTPHEIKTIVSRAGEGTKMILTGDPQQIDNPYLDASSNGLSYAVEKLKGQKIFGHVTLRKSERSPLSAVAADFL